MLEVKNVYYRYKGSNKDVLKDVSCRFPAGKVSAVVGPSGSGKSTLLSIIAGLDRPKDGSVFIEGTDIKTINLDLYRREKVSMIYQAFQLFPLLTAIENVCFPMELNGLGSKEALEKAKQFLESVGISEDKHNRFPSKLSGGEQQRVAIARTLGSGSRVLLADEPTGNLDSENGANVIAILKHLSHNENFCVIIVTHDLEIAENSDAVWKMKDGVLEEGT